MEPADMLYLHGRDPLVAEPNRYIITGDSGQVSNSNLKKTKFPLFFSRLPAKKTNLF
jgi:hypothetical protein